MKKGLWLAVLVVAFVMAASGRSQESLVIGEPIEQQLEFLRNLRNKGFATLGNEYIEILLKKADKANITAINLEKARNAAALAKEGKTPDQKAKLLSEARGYFEPFVKANPKSVQGAQARLELAKLMAMQAKTIVNKAYGEEDEKTKEAGAKQARDMYDAADAEFAEGIKVLAAVAKGGKAEEAELVQAQFDRANTMVDKAYAFLNLSDNLQNRQRAETVDAARKVFLTLGQDKTTTNGLLANAYLVKIFEELQDPPKREEHYGIVMNATGKFAEPAQRLARYFDILYVRKNDKIKVGGIEKIKLMATEAQKWVKEYPSARKSYQGESLRFEEALAYLQIAASLTDGFKAAKYEKLKINTKDFNYFNTLTKDVERITRELEAEDGDFADRATRLKQSLQVELLKLGGSKQQPKGFEGALLIAQLAFAEAKKAEKDEDRKKHLREGLVLLQKAVAQGYQEKAPLAKVHDAQFNQGAVYVGIGDYRRGAIAFEDLARADPPSRKGAEAAAYAVELYRTFSEKERDETARARLRELADYIFKQKLWAEERVIGVTRYNLALDFQAEEKFKEALDHLEKLPKDFPAYTYAQGQSLFIAMKARDNAETAEEKKAWTKSAHSALDRLGVLPASADASTTLMWFIAKLEGPKFLYAEAADLLKNSKDVQAEKVYRAMSKQAEEIEEVFKKSGEKLSPERKDGVEFTLSVLKKYAKLGLADIEYRRGTEKGDTKHYDNMLSDDLLGATIKEVLEKRATVKEGEKIKVKDVRVVGESLSLGLRAYVQLGNIDAAKAMYDLILRIDNEEGGADNLNFTRALIRDLAQQVDTLKEKNDTKQLKEMVVKFSGFVDELSKQLVYENKNPDAADIKNLARFYESLDQFDKGAALYKKVSAPKFLDQKGVKFSEEQEQELSRYWDLQIAFGRLQRLSKDYKGANKTLAGVVVHPNGRWQTLAEKEQIHIYEDIESFGTAIKLWSKYMETLQRAGLADKPHLKERYFEGYYYNALCFYKFSQTQKVRDAGKEDQYLGVAANYIYRLETAANREGWQIIGPRFEGLLSREKKLRDKYETLKKK